MSRLIFMGSPQIAVPSLKALLAAGHEVCLVVTQPDKPQGRGQKLSPPPVKVAALELGLKVLQPQSVKTSEFVQTVRVQKADGIVVIAYGKILNPEIIHATPLGCINVHFSLLPKYRGAACVPYALMNGDNETGTTTMVIDEGLDSGPILMQWTEAIRPEDTTTTLTERLAELGAQQIVKTLEQLEAGNLEPIPQDESRATFAPRLKKEQGHMNWNQPAQKVYNLYRGLTPWPGVFGFLRGKRILLTDLNLDSLNVQGEPGCLETDAQGNLYIYAAPGRLRIRNLKPEGKRVLSAEEFVRGLQDKTSLRLE